jgi:methylenetetrahydrofolate/methylenetetrahydromethanopterin dehydrogenase (NADP+)
VQKLLVQLDSSPHPSVFDRVVAFDGGADQVMSYGGITEDAVRDLVHGAIFTRGPKDLHNTAIFVGGTDMTVGERLLKAVTKAFFGPMRVSVMLDSNGSNTTAAAAVTRLRQAAGEVRGRRVVITAGTGPVGVRAAGLFGAAGAQVVITSRKPADPTLLAGLQQRFGANVQAVTMTDPSQAGQVLDGAQLLLNAGPAGVLLVPRDAWAGRDGLIAVADVNAVPPAGIEGVDAMDDGIRRDGVTVFGALAVGKLKMKVHKACIRKLFEKNDWVLDAESIAQVAEELSQT